MTDEVKAEKAEKTEEEKNVEIHAFCMIDGRHNHRQNSSVTDSENDIGNFNVKPRYEDVSE